MPCQNRYPCFVDTIVFCLFYGIRTRPSRDRQPRGKQGNQCVNQAIVEKRKVAQRAGGHSPHPRYLWSRGRERVTDTMNEPMPVLTPSRAAFLSSGTADFHPPDWYVALLVL